MTMKTMMLFAGCQYTACYAGAFQIPCLSYSKGVRLSVCLLCHTAVLCQIDANGHHKVFTVCSTKNSTNKIFKNYQNFKEFTLINVFNERGCD